MSLLVDIEKRLGNFMLRSKFEASSGTMALLGASGCGKSVTLRCIAGIMTPDSGRIVLDGETLFDSEKHIDLTPQQQRVALARTLTQDPHIILADEPVAALDPVTAKQVMEDFVHINQELGISILLNIHHVELALEYADRVIGIRAGRIVYDGPSKQVDQTVLDAIYGEDAVSEAAV